MEPSEAEIRRMRARLETADIDALVDFMVRTLFSGPAEAADPAARALAAELGWIEPGSGRFTSLGWLAADSCREYRFWTERDGRLPFEGAGGAPGRAAFAGRSVLEIGCGMGANLMSLEGVAGARLGIEPVAVYRELGAVFRARAGLAPVEIRPGRAEALPLPEASADIVLCVTAHQYMDIPAALAEMARVLRPGGELLLIGGSLDTYLRQGLRPVLGGSLSAAANYLRTVANTLGYMVLRRRPLARRGQGATANPVYPGPRFMRRRIREAGLEPVGAPVPIPPETCYRARRPAR